MPDIAVCPEPSVLKQLLLGQFDQGESAALDQHLLACERCCTVLHELEAHDTLAYAVRALTAEEPPLDDRVEAVIERLKGVTLPGKAFDETIARNVEATEDAWDLEKFLDPPEAEGELGRFGGYRVLRVLGAGGMGLVFEAEELKLRRRVALKVMKRSLAAKDEHHQRFLREARAAAAIEHPHIVTVFQVGEHRGLPFMAMQLLKGESLDDRLRHEAAKEKEDGLPSPSSRQVDGLAIPARRDSLRGALPLNEVLRIGRETAEALVEAHSRNLIHRDIKPGNIWLEGAKGWVKLLDFGLAHAAEDVHLTQTGAILGTPAYMSPEQARGETVDGRCDLYSLGAVLFKLTTGEVPFRGATTLAVLMALANDAPRPPREINPDLPQALNDLTLRLLAKKPEQRFESAAAVAEAIRAIEAERASPKSEVQSPKSDDGDKRRRPRWPLVAAAAAALFVLATIVIIVRDKQGNEVLRATVPDKGSVTLSENDAPDKENKVDKAASADIPPPIEVPEPPPLEEWLKGRTVLTVAQDGSGQFKTIQAALDALHPGQVVEVLDRGPYRETLYAQLPPNTGLVSDRQTLVEIAEPRPITNSDYPGGGHALFNADGFRISGFVFGDQQVDKLTGGQFVVTLLNPSGVVVERCWLRCRRKDPWCAALDVAWWGGETPAEPCFVRECLFDGELVVLSSDAQRRRPAMVVERNWFREADLHAHLWITGNPQAVVRHNVFEGLLDRALSMTNTTGTEGIEIYNNTLPLTRIALEQNVENRKVTVRNNLLGGNTAFFGEATEELPRAIAGWRVGRNQYAAVADAGHFFPKRPSDLFGEFEFISSDSSNPNYRRLRRESPTATSGAGGAWPSYIGALPPGPAPKDGDWFTRLRERWRVSELKATTAKVAAIPPPIKLPEPPPLEEWLKGREILTVAQDGSGQFKTIQAALDALQSGQVVEVLDAGPYRERLEVDTVPPDTGLISRIGTIIELREWKFGWKEERGDFYLGHVFRETENFRLHGFEFVFPEAIKLGRRISIEPASKLVVENCYFHQAPGDAWSCPEVMFGVYEGTGGPERSLWWVRGCLIEGYFDLIGRKPDGVTAVVEQNYFVSDRSDHHLHFHGGDWRQVVVRHNLFCGKVDYDLLVQDVAAWKPSSLLEVSNNTTTASFLDLIVFTSGVPGNGVSVRNNLRTTPRLLRVLGVKENLAAAQAAWRVDHNAYPEVTAGAPAWLKEDLMPRSSADITAMPRFLSKDPTNRDYLRMAADGPLATAGAGGDWPSYVGALASGPAPNEGDWFTRLREQWHSSELEATSADMADISPPIRVAEPPPLEEWLEGRKVITVAQDGSGQFKTIQSALDALKPHQVVKVLDAGPYREVLRVDGLPDDVGLIGQRRATVELTAWPDTPNTGGLLVGHTFNSADGFRLSGLRFVAPSPGERPGTARMVQLTRFSGLVIEDCCFGWTGKYELEQVSQLLQIDNDGGTGVSSVEVRDCLFDSGAVQWDGEEWPWPGALVVERCFFNSAAFALGAQQVHDMFIRHNVFCGNRGTLWVHRLKEITGALEISNNTALLGGYLMFKDAPTSGITLCNNLAERDLVLGEESNKVRAEIAKNWRRNHNGYGLRSALPKSPTDVTDGPVYLSSDPAARDFARVAEGGALAHGGAGGDWPGYIGAFPPGPAPKDGDWFTRIQERWPHVAPAHRDGSDSPLPQGDGSSPPRSVGATLPEPPPLEEWLKGRTVLTVAQDGSGQFKTIQAALDALKPHQVVRVLDRGPYREAIQVLSPPEDVGLMSDQQAVLEITGWIPEPNAAFAGFKVFNAAGFRLHGLTIRFKKPAKSQPVVFSHSADVVVEQCVLRDLADAFDPEAIEALAFHWADDGQWGHGAACLRDTAVDGAVILDLHGGKKGSALLLRNYFTNRGPVGWPSILIAQWGGVLELRDNLVDTRGGGLHIDCIPDAQDPLILINNTVLARSNTILADSNAIGSSLPLSAVLVNNIFESGLGLQKPPVSVGDIGRLGPNAYLSEMGPDELPRQPHDLKTSWRFLSDDFGDRNFARPVPESPLATRGAGGDWSRYLGALPPGPAPENGDWFTRLQERWRAAQSETTPKVSDIPPPIMLPEPPPLDEWLKGREILTVAQDGSAQFKTIQAALDALQPGQVVSVLDRGPYRERLVLEGIPRDTGLISNAGTVIELAEWKFAWKEEGGDLHFGHVFADIDGFRLHGFEWGFPEKITLGRRLYFRRTGRLLLEDCHFRSRSTDTWDAEPVVLENFDDQGPALSIWVRHCLIEGYLSIVAQGAVDVTAVVEQNDFKSEQADHHLHLLGDAWKQVVVRHNVFRGDANFDMVVDRGWKPSSLLEVSNNTSLTTPRDLVVFQASAEHGSVTVRNNLRTAPRLLGVLNGAEKDLLTAQRDWHVDHNAYPDPPATQPWMKDEAVPRSASDVAMRPAFLSKDPADPDYLRIRADGPLVTAGAGGDWPNYVGALPPGPPPKDGDWLTRLRERWQVSP